MFHIEDILQNWPWPLKVNTFLVALFFLLVASTVISLIILRVYKNKRDRKKQLYQDRVDSFLNNSLFDDEFDLGREIQSFKASHLVSKLQRNIAVRQILVYHKNLKGESSDVLKKIFHGLKLDEFILGSLKNGKWYNKAKAIYALSELHIKESKTVAKYLNDKHETVRAQAIYFFIKTADNDPLAFFAKLEHELTLWEQIQIEDSLKLVYQGPTPDFSMWLNHKLSTVLIFSIRMIQQFNQFEHISSIVPFLQHQDEHVRKEAVSSLRKFNYEGLLNEVAPRFSKESRLVKKEIIQAVESLGDLNMLYGLKPRLASKEEWQTNLMFLRAEKRMRLTL